MQYISFYKNKIAEKRRHIRIKQIARKRALEKRKQNWWHLMFIKKNALLPITLYITHVDYSRRIVTGIAMNSVGHTADEAMSYHSIRKMGSRLKLAGREDKIKALKKEIYSSSLNPYRKIKDTI